QWLSWDSDRLDDILESLEGDMFAFVFEVESLEGQTFSKLDYIHEKLGELAYGVLLVEPSSEALAQAEEALSAYRLTVKSNAVHLPGWQLACQGEQFSGAPLIVFKLQNQSLADTKALLEGYCKTFSPEMPGGLLIVEDLVSAKDVQDLKLMAELLGC
ncbi:MAG: hypothetical protein R3219_04060, partial [Hydrogenovibrio sp.]|nr:hypothetical protein [Hydrogenovibrio sp.]